MISYSDDDEVLQTLERTLAEAERQVVRLRATIATYRASHNGSDAGEVSTGGTVPAILDVCRYLRNHRPGPARQIDIITFISESRKERYPRLKRHCSIVWRALQFHVNTGRLIACVDPVSGCVVDLKPLEKRPNVRKLEDTPTLYDVDNWYVLKEDMVEGRCPAKGPV